MHREHDVLGFPNIAKNIEFENIASLRKGNLPITSTLTESTPKLQK